MLSQIHAAITSADRRLVAALRRLDGLEERHHAAAVRHEQTLAQLDDLSNVTGRVESQQSTLHAHALNLAYVHTEVLNLLISPLLF